MRAVSLKGRELALREIVTPEPGAGQLLVRTLACAICASDHHYMDHPEISAADRSGMRVDAPDHDVVMGHEFCAEVVAYGPESALFIPAGVWHVVANTGDEPVTMVFVFPGPGYPPTERRPAERPE